MLEIIVLALWAFSFSYLAIILGIPKNRLYIVVGFSILFVGGILIVYLIHVSLLVVNTSRSLQKYPPVNYSGGYSYLHTHS
ncbi:hypothetical protein CN433_16675 [Bacillus cereus]|nr:hypothetical protein CON87_23555 [Bacillus cereus]PET09917.1 hypothetical protein CN516_18180 [Bacillus cereus]PEV88302.1 hypothetical protein CN433_16675 [Bacillus cereus]PFP56369.1 hypothetical protein COJ98_04955 [Bacillus cereus]